MAEFIDIMADCFFTEYEENIAYDKAEKAIAKHDKQIRAEAIDECIKIVEETVWKDSEMLVEYFKELKAGGENED